MSNPANWSEAIAGRLLGTYDAESPGESTDLAALVSTRIAPSKPTQDPEGDHVSFWLTGGGDGAKLSGRNGLKPFDVRVEATATTQAGAEAILIQVDALLDGWRDRDRGVQGCFAVGDRDEDTLQDGRQVSGQTYRLWFKAQ